MKVAVWHNLPSGGGKRALYDHVKGLTARGHVVESWCPPTADQEFLPMGDLVPEHIVPLEMFDRKGPRAWARLRTAGSLTSALLASSDQHSRACATAIEERGFDIVLAASSQLYAVTSLARHLRLPSLLYHQEPARRLYEAQPRLPWVALDDHERFHLRARLQDAFRVHALRLQARAELEGVQAYDRVLCNSSFSRESMLRAYGIDAPVCYLGVDSERYQDLGRPRQRVVVGLSAFQPWKRIEVVIRAVAAMDRPLPALWWIGNAADPAYFEQMVRLAQQEEVDFTPHLAVSHAELVRLLNEAWVMAYAPRLEPFGYAPLEAAACGVPVVAVSEGGVRETVVNGVTGLLVDSERDLPRALQQVVDDAALARRLGQAGRRKAETTWSLAAATDRLEAHLFDLVGEASLARATSR